MKKKIEIISILLVIVIVIISTILLTNKDDNKALNSNESTIAYYYQNGSGYSEGSSNTWTTGYVLNIGKSSCNNQENPKDILDWDSTSKTVLMTSNETNNCTLYFDKVTSGQTYTAEQFFTSFTQSISDGELLKHTTSLPNSAGDDGYRYSGNNPNNFICFGPGSSDYNNGISGAKCEDGNLYRIIGYVPVELSDGTKENRIKVIKSEYVTSNELGISSGGNVYYDLEYTVSKRVKNVESVQGFNWNKKENNNWTISSLYNALNTSKNGFMYKLKTTWTDKIETVIWNVGGYNSTEISARRMYDIENDIQYGASSKVSAKIGLIYPSDYGFASYRDSWTLNLWNYDNDSNRENNWLFNGVDEWTIFSFLEDGMLAYFVDFAGSLNSGEVFSDSYISAVRPVFYLKSDVKLVNDNNIDGSASHPYRVN